MKNIIAGVDEVGRGSLVGPVYAAAVILKKTAHFNKNFSVPDRFLFAFSKADSIGHFLKPVPFPTKRTVDNGPWFI